MTEVERLLRAIAEATDEETPYALVGGFAVSARTEPRFTRDVDVAIATADDRQAEKTVRRFTDRSFQVSAIVEQEAVGRIATVRLVDQAGGQVDVLFASSGIEREIVAASEPVELLPGVVVPVATIGHLLAMKLLSEADDRPADRADLVALTAAASTDDLAQARLAVDLITQRGYARERDLGAALDALIG